MTIIHGPLLVLVIVLSGIALAWLGFKVVLWLPMFVIVLGVITGWGLADLGRNLVPKRPVNAVRLMSTRLLIFASIGAFAVFLGVNIAVRLEPGQDWTVESKKLAAATVGALSAYLTAAFIKDAEDADGKWVAPYIKAAFQRTFQGRFPAGEARNAVFSDTFHGHEGWGPKARVERARVIQEALG